MSEAYSGPGGIQFESLLLINHDQSKTINILPIVYEMNIFESINRPFVTASFIIDDALSLHTQFPIIGQEQIYVKFKTPGSAFLKSIELMLRVVSIQDYKREKIRESSYIINCVSPAMIKDMNTKIRKAYQNMRLSDMASSVLIDYLGGEFIKVDPSIGERTIIVPNMSPSNAIKMFARLAKSEKYESSPYYFYQTCDGFYFRTSNDIIDPVNKTKYSDGSSIDKYYGMDFDFPKGVSPRDVAMVTGGGYSGGGAFRSTKPYEFLKIKSFNFHNMGNYADGFKMGYLENRIAFIDPVTSFYQEKQYDYIRDNDSFKKTSQSQASMFLTRNNDYIKDGEGFVLFEPTNHTQVNTYGNDQRYEVLNQKIGVKNLFNNINATVTIPGDSEKRAGDVVDLEFPEYGATDDVEGELNKFISGEYIILAIRHVYNINGYETVMDVSKNAYEQSIESVNARSTSTYDENVNPNQNTEGE